MNYKEIRGNLLRILLLGLSLSLVESLNIECEHERHSFCWSSESKTVKECSSCNIYEAQLLEMVGEAVVITSDNNSENFKVERLSFEEGTLNYTPMTEILRSFPNLKHLSFSSTIIPNINEEMLGNLSQLDSFEISSVQFKIALMSFSSAVNLQSLSIIRNDNSKFSNYCFYGLQNLISLSLTEDNLKQVDNFWFLEMQKLEQLDLSYNQVKMLEDYVFEELKSLLYLNLAYNEIENISKKLFQFNINLKSINLRHNKIYSIQIGSFGNLRNLNFLILEANVCVNKKFITEELPNIEGALDDCHVVLTTTEEPGDSCEVPDIPNGRIWGSEGGVSKYLQVVGSSYTDLDPVQVKCDDGFYFPQKAESKNK